jgi:uncharacterized protein (DUF697 family)
MTDAPKEEEKTSSDVVRSVVALVACILGLVAVTVGATIAWGPGIGCLIAGVLLTAYGCLLGYQ